MTASFTTSEVYSHTSTAVNRKPAIKTAKDETEPLKPVIPFTTKPNIICDQFMHMLSGAEYKVYDYISRRTFGFDKTYDNIAVEQFVGGIVTNDGKRLDYGTGLSPSSVKSALKSLLAKGLIGEIRRWGRHGGELASTYWIILNPDFGIIEGDEIYTHLGQNLTEGGAESDPDSVNFCPHNKKTPKKKVYRKKEQQHIPVESQEARIEKHDQGQDSVVVADKSISFESEKTTNEKTQCPETYQISPDELVIITRLETVFINQVVGTGLVKEYGVDRCSYWFKEYKASYSAKGTGWLIARIKSPDQSQFHAAFKTNAPAPAPKPQQQPVITTAPQKPTESPRNTHSPATASGGVIAPPTPPQKAKNEESPQEVGSILAAAFAPDSFKQTRLTRQIAFKKSKGYYPSGDELEEWELQR